MKRLLVFTALLLFAGITFGQTLEKGNILGMHTMTVTPNPDVTVQQYMDFFAKELIPKWEENFPGLELHVLKGIRGENENRIGLLFFLESVEIRDKYWSVEGQATALAQQCFAKFESYWVELEKLGTYSTVHTDWIVKQ